MKDAMDVEEEQEVVEAGPAGAGSGAGEDSDGSDGELPRMCVWEHFFG